jgi:uroporphyrinogen-III synthase
VAEAAKSPLAGKRVVVTRSIEQSSELCKNLRQRGATPILLPLISFTVPEDFAPFDSALRKLSEFGWLIFTSPNAVQAVVNRCNALGLPLDRDGQSWKVVAIGPGTRQQAERAGLTVDFIPTISFGLALSEELGPQLRGQKVFLPRSDRAGDDLPKALRSFGADVTEVVAYRTIPPSNIDRDRAVSIVTSEADAILFFSPSAAHNFVDLLGCHWLNAFQLSIAMVAVGPVTAAALREIGMDRAVVAANPTPADVVEALEQYFAENSGCSAQVGAQHR